MNDYNEYTYNRTLQFFEAYYPYDVEDVHYSEVLLSMNQCTSIDKMMAVRERLKDKVNKGVIQSNLEKIPDEIIKQLAKCGSRIVVQNTPSFKGLKAHLNADIDTCYNENIVRLLQEKDTITAEFCGECFVNLSNCSNNIEKKNIIIQIAKERADLDVKDLLETISKRYKDLRKHWNKYKGFKKGMNEYIPAKKAVEDDFNYLKQFNWRLLPQQKSLYSEIDREELKKREEETKLRRKRKEEREKKKIEEEKRKFEEERYNYMMKIGIGVTVFVVILVLSCMYVSPEVMNWILAILIILALLK